MGEWLTSLEANTNTLRLIRQITADEVMSLANHPNDSSDACNNWPSSVMFE
jgi:hypothetical protein